MTDVEPMRPTSAVTMPATITDEPTGRLLASRTEMSEGPLVGEGLVVGRGVGVADGTGVGVGVGFEPGAEGAGADGGAVAGIDDEGNGEGVGAGRICNSRGSVAWMR